MYVSREICNDVLTIVEEGRTVIDGHSQLKSGYVCNVYVIYNKESLNNAHLSTWICLFLRDVSAKEILVTSSNNVLLIGEEFF